MVSRTGFPVSIFASSVWITPAEFLGISSFWFYRVLLDDEAVDALNHGPYGQESHCFHDKLGIACLKLKHNY